jgi:uncharacterized protein YkwD
MGKAIIMTIITRINVLVVTVLILALSVLATSDLTNVYAADGANLDSEEQAFIGLLNDYRHANGLGDISIDNTLEQATRWMAQDMGDKNYFSHTDSLGRDPFMRMADFGSDRDYEGEDLAAGRGSAGEALSMWQNSPAHNEQLLVGQYTKIGISRYFKAGSTYGWYWALDLSN